MVMDSTFNINWNLNFPIEDGDSEVCYLFHCCRCGYHSKAIREMTINNNTASTIIQILSITPCEMEIVHQHGNSNYTDDEHSDTYICGICGSAGQLLPVPRIVLVNSNLLSKQLGNS